MKKITGMDWGNITPEIYSEEKNCVIHIYNHSLSGTENISRTIRFAAGRIHWFKEYLSLECSHEIVFDDRGQDVDDRTRDMISKSLNKQGIMVKFTSKRW